LSSTAKGKIITIVAPSGSGKTTIASRLLKEFPKIKFSVSATTRDSRPGEIHGKDYYFLSNDEFSRKVDKNMFLEWEIYNSDRYGTLRKEVDKLMESGYFPLLDIEVKGALNVKKMYGSDCVSIFIQPPSLEVLKERLEKRGSETEKSLDRRLEIARKEMKYADHFDHNVINDDLETAYEEVKHIVKSYIAD
jgi:guanylate kinase